jgi:hypothetical protein
MRHPTLNPVEREADLTRLDEMIAEVERLRDTDLLREHMQSARQYLFGAMPEEYLVSLEWAKRSLDTVPDGNLRSRMDDALAKLIAAVSTGGPHDEKKPSHVS